MYKGETLIKRDATIPPFPVPEFVYDAFIKFTVTGFVSRGAKEKIRLCLRAILLLVGAYFLRKMLSHQP